MKPDPRVLATYTITQVRTNWVTTVSAHVSWCSGSCAQSTAKNQNQYENSPVWYAMDDDGEECYPDDNADGYPQPSMQTPPPLGQTQQPSLQPLNYPTPAVVPPESTSAAPAGNGQTVTVTHYTSTAQVVSTMTVTQPIQVTDYGATVTVTNANSTETVTRTVTQTATVSETVILGVLPPESQSPTNNQMMPDSQLPGNQPPPSIQIPPSSQVPSSSVMPITLTTSDGQNLWATTTSMITSTTTTETTTTMSGDILQTFGTNGPEETTMTASTTGKLEPLVVETTGVRIIPAGVQLITSLSITITETMTATDQGRSQLLTSSWNFVPDVNETTSRLTFAIFSSDGDHGNGRHFNIHERTWSCF